jgi:hypothetical protein
MCFPYTTLVMGLSGQWSAVTLSILFFTCEKMADVIEQPFRSKVSRVKVVFLCHNLFMFSISCVNFLYHEHNYSAFETNVTKGF